MQFSGRQTRIESMNLQTRSRLWYESFSSTKFSIPRSKIDGNFERPGACNLFGFASSYESLRLQCILYSQIPSLRGMTQFEHISRNVNDVFISSTASSPSRLTKALHSHRQCEHNSSSAYYVEFINDVPGHVIRVNEFFALKKLTIL